MQEASAVQQEELARDHGPPKAFETAIVAEVSAALAAKESQSQGPPLAWKARCQAMEQKVVERSRTNSRERAQSESRASGNKGGRGQAEQSVLSSSLRRQRRGRGQMKAERDLKRPGKEEGLEGTALEEGRRPAKREVVSGSRPFVNESGRWN